MTRPKEVMMKLLLAILVALAFGGGAVALEVGDRIGPIRINPGGVICNTEAQTRQIIDRLDRKESRMVNGCGTLGGYPYALIEAIAMHSSSRAVYMILKITFLLPATLGVQYGWQKHSKAPDAINGDSA